ncbi:MAG TPA: PAS domain S-box protein [Methanobacteriaceae archaeon]|nr:PAS domain S-box protein [Methanobacteriaceae archaeon]
MGMDWKLASREELLERVVYLEEKIGAREENLAYLASIVENSDDAIVGKDLNGKILSWNQAAENIYGYSPEEVLGKSMAMLISPDLPDELDLILTNIKKGQTIRHYETVRIRKDKKPINVSITISPIKDKNGQLLGASSITRDITRQKAIQKKITESEEKFRELFNHANDAIFLHPIIEGGKPGHFTEVNDVACQVLGYSREELLQMEPADIDNQATVKKIPQFMKEIIERGEATFESVQVTKDGRELPVEINSHRFQQRGQDMILSIARDITERKRAQNALKESERKFRKIFENVQDVFYQTDNNGTITEISPSIERYSGFTPQELIGKPVEEVYFNPQDRKSLLVEITDKGEVVDYELRLKSKEDREIIVSLNAHLLFDSNNQPIGMEGSLRDITYRKRMELELKQSLEEKEMLLKEIHHRVKNNLMVISSLLNLQSRYIKDKAVLKVFQESQRRARTMALIHEKLYQSTDLKRINFGDYLKSLGTEIFRTYVTNPELVKMNMDVGDVMLDINIAIPLGLIFNELLSNSLKHAFPNNRAGNVTVYFHKDGAKYQFMVKDDGVGLPAGFNMEESDTLGLRLVSSLIGQIDGDLEVDYQDGALFKITFKESRYGK